MKKAFGNFLSRHPSSSTRWDPREQKITKSFFLVVAFIIALFFLLGRTENARNIKYVKIGGADVKVELSLTRDEQVRGLSGRENLASGSGMLFVFPKPEEHHFWMKDMKISIDMIWIGEDNKVIYIKKDARPEDMLTTFGPNENSKYVLEVPAGFSTEHNLKEGDKVEFTY